MTASSGTPAAAHRAASSVHACGRNSRKPRGIGTSLAASVSETSAWQFARLPSWPQYCRATPTERVPFFGSAVSSITNAASGQPVGLLGQYPPQRLIVPGRAGDEVLQLVVPRQAQAGRHRLQALALARAKQPAQVQRRPSPPLLVPERSKERLQPHIQIPHGPTHTRFSKI